MTLQGGEDHLSYFGGGILACCVLACQFCIPVLYCVYALGAKEEIQYYAHAGNLEGAYGLGEKHAC